MIIGTDLQDGEEPAERIVVTLPITLRELAERIQRHPSELIKVAFQVYGSMVTPSSRLLREHIGQIACGLSVEIWIEDDDGSTAPAPSPRTPRSDA